MPAHKTHEAVGVTLSPLVLGASLYIKPDDITTAFTLTALYVVATFYFSPDLDTDSKPYYRWSMLAPLWYPYKRLIKHRSWLSHSGPISGTIRFFYFYVLVVLCSMVFKFDLLTYAWVGGILWIAIILADTVHTVLDFIWKG